MASSIMQMLSDTWLTSLIPSRLALYNATHITCQHCYLWILEASCKKLLLIDFCQVQIQFLHYKVNVRVIDETLDKISN